MKDRLSDAEKIRRVLRHFEKDHPPTFLYDAMARIRLDSPDAFHAALDGLGCREWRGALACLRALAKRRPRPELAVPAIEACLEHAEELVRQDAALALGTYGAAAESAVPALVKGYVEADEAHPRMAYARALGLIARHPDLVLPALVRHVEGAEADDYSVPAAIEAIGGYGAGARHVVPILEPLLGSPDWQVRGAAFRTLQAVDPDPARVIRLAGTLPAGEFLPLLDSVPGDFRPDELVRALLPLDGLRTWRGASVLRRFVRSPRFTDLRGLEEALGDPGRREHAAELLAVRGDRAVVPALRAAAPGPWVRRALLRLGEKLPAPEGTIDLERAIVALHRLGWRVAGEGVGTTVPVHRVLEAAPAEDWADDADEFGVARLGPDGAVVHPLSATWPRKPNGASGAKRRIQVVGRGRGGLLVSIESPFSDARGWGKDNFLFVARPDGTWARLGPDGAGHPVDGWEEDPGAAICTGELVVRREGGVVRLVADCTPYHLDDWEHVEAPVSEFADPDPGPESGGRIEVRVEGPELWEVAGRRLADPVEHLRGRLGGKGSVGPLAAFREGGRILLLVRSGAGDALVVLAE